MFSSIVKRVSLHRFCNYLGVRKITEINDGVSEEKQKVNEASSCDGANAENDEELLISASLFGNSSWAHEPKLAKQMLQKNNKWVQANSSIQTSTKPKKSVNKKCHQSEVIDDPELGLKFVRLDLHDPALSTLMTAIRSRKRRNKNREIVVEGRRFICEAVECQLQMFSIIFSQKKDLRLVKEAIVQAQSQQISPVKIYKVPQHDLKMWSTLTTPPGLLAIFQRPSAKSIVDYKLKVSSDYLPITVVCDNIREPNNLGSIIRTCAALPCYQVLVTRGCCDPWESKALRGGCGGQFRMNIRDQVDWENLHSLIPAATADDCCVFIAENNLTKKVSNGATVTNYLKIGRTGAHNVVIVGGESYGVSEEAYRFLNTVGHRGKCLYIPLANGVDSLNVTSALTLILYELRKYLINDTDETKTF